MPRDKSLINLRTVGLSRKRDFSSKNQFEFIDRFIALCVGSQMRGCHGGAAVMCGLRNWFLNYYRQKKISISATKQVQCDRKAPQYRTPNNIID